MLQTHHTVAGLPAGTETVARRPEIEGDPDREFSKALAKSHAHPRGFKSGAPEESTAHLSGVEKVNALIKDAHAAPGAVIDLERGYAAREVAKGTALLGLVGRDERGEVFDEGGEKLIRISKVL